MAGSVGQTIADGSLLLALPIAFAAGVLSFLSPCVLPLVPAYLSYITGLTGAELAGEADEAPAPVPVGAVGVAVAPRGAAAAGVADVPGAPPAAAPSATMAAPVHRRSRVLAGTLLFVAGFTVVFVSYGALFGSLGATLLAHEQVITRALGAVVVVMGLAFMGLLPGLQREYRWHRRPGAGLWGAPVLGALFGLGWTPCIGPTLAAVQSLAFTEGNALRGAILSLAYCLGLGLPFLLVGLAFRRGLGALGWVKRHYALVMRVGGGLLVLLGLLLMTGLWGKLSILMRTWVGGFEVPL